MLLPILAVSPRAGGPPKSPTNAPCLKLAAAIICDVSVRPATNGEDRPPHATPLAHHWPLLVHQSVESMPRSFASFIT
jgi:hypothetical protein